MKNNELEVRGLRLVVSHIHSVQYHMSKVLANLTQRLVRHDISKYTQEEIGLVVGKPALDAAEYMSDEELTIKASIGSAIKAHYKSNSHHPEHFTHWECNGCFKAFGATPPANLHCDECLCEVFEQPLGVDGMSLFDLIEMLCDWKAASEASHNGNILNSIEFGKERFALSPQMVKILTNTAKELDWL